MKHAYLIMAHTQENLLNKLLEILDNENNDIFLHIDQKMKLTQEINLKKSNLYFIESRRVNWGGYTQIQLEIDLLKTATQIKKYDYYHLLSGQDLPIKDNEYINHFFEKNNGKEFVDFESKEMSEKTLSRVKLYHLFQEKAGNNRKSFYFIIEKLCLIFQKILNVDRTKKISNVKFAKGANWFSITDDLARYVIENEFKIKELFRNTVCCDEMFLQTLIRNSKYQEKISDKGFLRYIVWKDSKHPCIWKEENFEELMNTDCLFARKFDENVDKKIIDRVYEKIKSK